MLQLDKKEIVEIAGPESFKIAKLRDHCQLSNTSALNVVKKCLLTYREIFKLVHVWPCFD